MYLLDVADIILLLFPIIYLWVMIIMMTSDVSRCNHLFSSRNTVTQLRCPTCYISVLVYFKIVCAQLYPCVFYFSVWACHLSAIVLFGRKYGLYLCKNVRLCLNAYTRFSFLRFNISIIICFCDLYDAPWCIFTTKYSRRLENHPSEGE